MANERTPPSGRRLRQNSSVSAARRGKLYQKRELIDGVLDKSSTSERNSDQDSSRQTVEVAERSAEKAGQELSNVSHRYSQKLQKENLEERKKATDLKGQENTSKAAKDLQKKKLKQEYAKVARENRRAASNAGSALGKGGKEASKETKDMMSKLMNKLAEFVSDHPLASLIIVLVALVVFLVIYVVNICGLAMGAVGSGGLGATYTANDYDILAVEKNYTEMEQYLKESVESLAKEYSGYDEYVFNMDDFGHEPHELISYLTVMYHNFRQWDVTGELQHLIDLQYEVSTSSVTETRYYAEERTGYIEQVKKNEPPLEDEVILIPYFYYEIIPYEYSIFTVTVKNRGINNVVRENLLPDKFDELGLYAVLVETKGGKPELFENTKE